MEMIAVASPYIGGLCARVVDKSIHIFGQINIPHPIQKLILLGSLRANCILHKLPHDLLWKVCTHTTPVRFHLRTATGHILSEIPTSWYHLITSFTNQHGSFLSLQQICELIIRKGANIRDVLTLLHRPATAQETHTPPNSQWRVLPETPVSDYILQLDAPRNHPICIAMVGRRCSGKTTALQSLYEVPDGAVILGSTQRWIPRPMLAQQILVYDEDIDWTNHLNHNIIISGRHFNTSLLVVAGQHIRNIPPSMRNNFIIIENYSIGPIV